MGKVFLGSEALAAGLVTRHELTRWHRRMFPDVYISKDQTLMLRDRIYGAWLWSRRRAVVAGVAASVMHGASYADVDIAIELIARNGRPPAGLVVRNDTVADDEIVHVGGMPVTTQERTAFDLGRYLPRLATVQRLDAMMWARQFSVDDVLLLAKRYPGARGLKGLRTALPLVDGGAASPQETRVRLLLIDAGFPRPQTQILVVEGRGRLVAVPDMGWREFGVVVNYDGDHHRTNRGVYVKDQHQKRKLESMGYIVIRVIAEDSDADIIARVERALRSRGWRPDREIALTQGPTRTSAA